MQPLFLIDGHKFQDIGVISLQRTSTVTEGQNSGTSLSGRIIRDVIGTKCDYTLTLSTEKMGSNDYDAFYALITAPVESHIVVLPYGQETITFEAYIVDVSDQLKYARENGNKLWGDLSVQFTAMEPQRRPTV